MHPPYPRHLQAQRAAQFTVQRQPCWFPSALREIAILATALTLYLLVRGLIRNRAAEAFTNADRLIAWERQLGFFWEPDVQRWALQHDWLITAANWIYVWAYWPTLAGTMLWLFLRHRAVVARYRNALLISGAIGLIGFATFPLAPPRFLLTLGFVDTVSIGSEAYATLYPSSIANWYAAMPSLHVGWTLLMGIALVSQARWLPMRAIGVLLPPAMMTATVLTANHFLADGIVGAGIAVIGLVGAKIAEMLSRRITVVESGR